MFDTLKLMKSEFTVIRICCRDFQKDIKVISVYSMQAYYLI